MLRYRSQSEVVATFGDPMPLVLADGSVSGAWETQILTTIGLVRPIALDWNPAQKARIIRCHRKIAPLLKAALDEIMQAPATDALIKEYAGCYAWRRQRGAKVLSRHSWGIAVDLNPDDNQLGHVPAMDPRVISVFAAHGFLWGGLFHGGRVDGMHFEFSDYELLTA